MAGSAPGHDGVAFMIWGSAAGRYGTNKKVVGWSGWPWVASSRCALLAMTGCAFVNGGSAPGRSGTRNDGLEAHESKADVVEIGAFPVKRDLLYPVKTSAYSRNMIS